VRTTLLTLALLLAAGLAAGPSRASETPAAGRPLDEGDRVRRELRIGGDVLRAALSETLPANLRIVDLEAGYLTGQGVLVIVDLSSPWFRVDGDSIEVEPDIAHLEQIPDMVHEILSELNLGLTRYQTEELQELRDIRDTQRAARAEQRALRAELRQARRERQQAGNPEAAAALDESIASLRTDIAALDEELLDLNRDADTARQTLNEPTPGAQRADSMDTAVADAVCAYGATFQWLAGNEHLNVLLRRFDRSRYFVFDISRVRACQTGDISSADLLETAFGYEF
jgi:hypothetical protein